MRSIFLLYGLFCCSLVTDAQITLSDTMKEFHVRGQQPISTSKNLFQIDSSVFKFFKTSSLDQILSLYSNIAVKNYGVGSFSTMSIRGSSSAQTQVLWNGLNINNAMTGLSDLSSMPITFFDQISIAWGNDLQGEIMGGAVLLETNKPQFQKATSLQLSYGYESLENHQFSATLKKANQKICNRLNVTLGLANNQFDYFNVDQAKLISLEHAQSKQVHILNDFYYKMSKVHQFSFHAWLQGLSRQIPPASFEDMSAKEENVRLARSLVKWQYKPSERFNVESSAGLMAEGYHYHDSLIQLTANQAVINIPIKTLINYSLHKHHSFHAEISTATSFLTLRKQAELNRMRFQLSYEMNRFAKILSMKASLQKEMTNLFAIPLQGSLLMKAVVRPVIKAYFSYSGSTRLPTLNELYYQPGGNVKLKPEIGLSKEFGMSGFKKWMNHTLSSDIAIYNRKVENWITWFGSTILTPHNIQEVWSRGFEINSSYEKQLVSQGMIINEGTKKTNWYRFQTMQLSFNYAYTLSTTSSTALLNDYSLGKQIPYVPRYQFKGSLAFKGPNVELRYIHTYAGYRFITTDESAWLKPYHTSHLLLQIGFNIKHSAINLIGRLNNMFDTNYEGVIGRVMPGRNGSIGFSVNLNAH